MSKNPILPSSFFFTHDAEGCVGNKPLNCQASLPFDLSSIQLLILQETQ